MGEADAATIRLLRESLDEIRFKCSVNTRYCVSASLCNAVAGGIDFNARVTQAAERSDVEAGSGAKPCRGGQGSTCGMREGAPQAVAAVCEGRRGESLETETEALRR